MDDAQELRRFRQCETLFESDLADHDRDGAPPFQCFLVQSDELKAQLSVST